MGFPIKVILELGGRLNSFAYSETLHAFCRLLIFFQNQLFGKIPSGMPSLSNSLDPDQARHIVGPDLGPNCLQRLSADDNSR